MVRSAVQVLLRTRPCNAPNSNVQLHSDKKTVVIKTDAKLTGQQGTLGAQYQFKFDSVLHEASQEDVYEAAAADVVQKALDGYNGTIMCYGQTGAGKTYTMSGGRQSYTQRGLIPRVITSLFSYLKARTDQEAQVSISYLEIYNEQLYDLLDITTQPHELNVMEGAGAGNRSGAGGTGGAGGVVRVQGLKSQVVGSEADAMKLLFEGETNRVIGEHQLNRESSRSHSIFQIFLEIRTIGDPAGVITCSKLSLVDLAGSERVSKTRSEGTVLREAGHINKSLSILEHVILALSEKGRDHVPYRSSRLTHVLKDSLGGNCATVLVANVWSEPDQTEETLSTCRFAQRMMRITCDVTPNTVEDTSIKVKQLQRQVAELQQELALHDSMTGRTGITYTPYNTQQKAMLCAQLDVFLDSDDPDSIAPIELHSLRHVREIMICLKSRVRAREQAAEIASAAAKAATATALANMAAVGTAGEVAEPLSPTSAMAARLAAPPSVGGASPASQHVQQDVSRDATAVSDQASASGVGASGRCSPALPIHGPDQPSPAAATATAAGVEATHSHSSVRQGSAVTPPPPSAPPAADRQAVLAHYKQGPGAMKQALLEDNKAKLKAAKKKAKELGLSINVIKHELDSHAAQLDQLKASRQARGGEQAQVLSNEELGLLDRIKYCKQTYKDQFTELQMLRSEVEYTQQLCATCTAELVTDFQAWYKQSYGLPLPVSMSLLESAPGDEGPPADVDPTFPAASTTSGFTSHLVQGRPQGPGVVYPERGALTQDAPLLMKQQNFQRTSETSSHSNSQVGRRSSVSTTTSPPPAAAGTTMAGRKSGPPPAAAPAAQALPGELNDPEAAAFYEAQHAMFSKTRAGLQRPGSLKKKLGPQTTFSTTHRS